MKMSRRNPLTSFDSPFDRDDTEWMPGADSRIHPAFDFAVAVIGLIVFAQRNAGNEIRLVRSEEKGGVRDVPRCAHLVAQWHAGIPGGRDSVRLFPLTRRAYRPPWACP